MHNTSFVYARTRQRSKSGFRPVLFSIVFTFLLGASSVFSQNCSAVFSLVTFPQSLGVCDLTFPVIIHGFHTYNEPRSFEVSIAYKPAEFTLANTGQLINVVITNNGIGTETLTGTWLIDENIDLEIYQEDLALRFNRVSSGFQKSLQFSITDNYCTPAAVTTFSESINISPAFTDLRGAPSNSVFWLLINDWLKFCTPNQSYTNNVLIEDELIVDNDICFKALQSSGSGFIALMPGAKIRVTNGHTLDIDNMEIYTCGVRLAQGIIVEPGAMLKIKNSTIRDCRFGIDARPGSKLLIESTNFVDNYIGVNFNMTGAPFATTILSFQDNHFFTENGLKQPFDGMQEAVETRGYCGIRVNNYKDFNVFGLGNANIPAGNHFSALANGIIAVRTPANLNNMTFDDMKSVGAAAYPLEGFGIHLSSKGGPYWANLNDPWHPAGSFTFNDCKVGVKAIHYGGGVENAIMTNVGVGIDWENSQDHVLNFENNTITAREAGIRSFLNEPTHPLSIINENTITITGSGGGTNPAMGIRLNEGGFGIVPGNPGAIGGRGWTINENHITMQNGGRGIQYRTGWDGLFRLNEITNLAQTHNYDGIWTDGSAFTIVGTSTITQSLTGNGLGDSRAIRSAGGWGNSFISNCVDNTNTGMQFYDIADFTDNVLLNAMNTHTTGLQLGDDVQGNVFIGDQHHTGNTWELGQIPAGGFGGVHWGGPGFAILSQFFVDKLENPSFNPPVDPGDGWFKNEPLPNPTPTGGGCTFPSPDPENPKPRESDLPTELDAAIVSGLLPTDGYGPEMLWKGRYRLYRKMLRRPALESYAPQYSAFKNAYANQALGRLAFISEEKAKLFQVTAAEQAASETYRSSLAQQRSNIRAMDEQRQAGQTIQEAQYATLLQERDNTLAQYEQFLANLSTTRLQKIQQLLTLNSSVITAQGIEANHKIVNDIVLCVLATDTLTSAHLTALNAIAAQCPLSGGDAVYEARAWVSHFGGQEFDDTTLCGAQRPSNGRVEELEKQEDEDIVRLFPNPTTGNLYWKGAKDAVSIRVFNMLGSVVGSISLAEQQVSLGHLPSGIYHVQLLDEGDVLLYSGTILINQ